MAGKGIRVKRKGKTVDRPDSDETFKLGDNAQKALVDIVSKLDNLMDEADDIKSDISNIYHGAKAIGFSTPQLRAAMKIHRMTPDKRQEFYDKRDAVDFIAETVE